MEKSVFDLFVNYLNNECTEEEAGWLKAWLEESDENMEVFINFKKLWAAKKVKLYESPEKLASAQMRFYERIDANQRKSKQIYLRRVLAYAAAIVLLVGIAWMFSERKGGERSKEVQIVQLANIDSVSVVSLADGTKVWLNKKSNLKYPIKFNKEERRVELDGEAFFEVKTDSLHPFIVQAKSILVRVYGTSFNVNTNNSDSTIKTVLIKGSVAVQNLEGDEMVKLQPGMMASYDQAKSKIDLSKANADYYTVWRFKPIVLKNATLAEIANKIEEVYKVSVVLESKSNKKINFAFNREQNIETVLEMLKYVVPIHYKINDKTVYIKQK